MLGSMAKIIFFFIKQAVREALADFLGVVLFGKRKAWYALSVCGMRQYMYRTRQVVFGGLEWFDVCFRRKRGGSPFEI